MYEEKCYNVFNTMWHEARNLLSNFISSLSLHILLISEKLYLVARFDNNDKDYTFRVSKIEDIEISNDYFDRDESSL